MKTVAEIRNADNVVLRTLQVEDTYVAPAQKFGLSFTTRIVDVTTAAVPVVDSSVITLTQTTTVTPGGVSFGWSQARRPNADIMDAIEDECSRRVSGFRGVMFLLLFQNLVSPTAGQTARANRLKQTLAFAENLKSQAATLTTITGANWP